MPVLEKVKKRVEKMAAYLCAVLLVVCAVFGQTEQFLFSSDSCFGSLGCFSNGAPWSTLFRSVPSPQSPDVIDTRYYLYTRNNASIRFTVLHPSDGVYHVNGSDFDGSKPTILIIHGFWLSGNATMMQQLKDAVLGKVDANVIIVDWGKGAGSGSYSQVVSNTRIVAATTVQLLKYLIASKGADVARLHLIGHSLGADIAGYVGKAIANIARITALDSAQPLMEGCDALVRLNLTDAVFIDAIHTDGRPFYPFYGHGVVDAVGHVDFFVNGGWNQPGCLASLVPNVTSFADIATAPVEAMYRFSECPHNRAVELLIASLNNRNCSFWGHKVNSFQRALSLSSGGLSSRWPSTCDATSCSALGFDAIHYPARGSFEVSTSGTPPFCQADSKADAIMKPIYTN